MKPTLKTGLKKLVSLLAVFSLLALCAPAGAEDWGFGLGGLTSLFSSDDDDGVVYAPGEKAVLDGCEVTLTNLMESKGTQYGKPSSGNVFVIVEFRIKNTSREDLAISSLLCFSASVDGQTLSMSLTANSVALLSGYMQFDMTIKPGKTGTGIVGYEVPKNWKTLRVTVKPDFYEGGRAVFETQRKR